MAVDIVKLIAAINPDVYCENSADEKGRSLRDKVKKMVKEQGYLAAAKIAKLREGEFMDSEEMRFIRGAFELEGIKNPVEQHKMIYDSFSQGLEPIYFWVLDYVNREYGGGAEKLVDNFVSSVGGGHFLEMQGKATRMQEEGMKMMGQANIVLRSILNLIYDLKEFKIKLRPYDDYHSKDKKIKNAALLSLKQTWMDNVDFKRGAGSINGLAQQLEFVTIRDAFMVANSLDDVKKLDLNDRVKRILEQRIPEFLLWIDESEKQLKKRFEIEKIYLKSQVNSLKLYARWAKPYFGAARKLEQNLKESADIINLFNTAVFELVLLAKGRYDPKTDIDDGLIPKFYEKLKVRRCTPFTLFEFRFRSAPDRADQSGSYGFRGRVEVTFTPFALNDDEFKVLKSEVEKDDFGDVYEMIMGATEKSLGQIKDDIDELISDGGSKGRKEEENSNDINPFSALFSFLKRDKKEEKKDFSKGIPKDNSHEKVLRSQAILSARYITNKFYNKYKVAHEMPSFPPQGKGSVQ